MKRRLFTIASALSLVLCVCLGAIGIDSYIEPHVINYRKPEPRINGGAIHSLLWVHGSLILCYESSIYWSSYTHEVKWHELGPRAEQIFKSLMRFGFCMKVGRDNSQIDNYAIAVPIWLLFLPSALLPVWWTVLFRRRRRYRKLGLCLNCGCDLRASKDQCPECGTAMSKGVGS